MSMPLKLPNPFVDDPQQMTQDLVNEVFSNSDKQFAYVVVYDVIFDPDLFREKGKYEEWIKEEGKTFKDSHLLDQAPRNSIVGKIITNRSVKENNYLRVFYPFWTHIKYPIKPGEHCLVFFPNGKNNSAIGYWMDRERTEENVDDINYTHSPRRAFSQGSVPSEHQEDYKDIMTNFYNGSDIAGDNEDYRILPTEDEYEKIYNESLAAQSSIEELVPRFKARPGDQVLQGSNNSMLLLGTDRPSGKSAALEEGEKDEYKERAVGGFFVGRSKSDDSDSSPSKIENKRGFEEVDKDAIRQNRDHNKREGELDYIHDRNHIAAYENTEADKNYELAGKYPAIDNIEDEVDLEEVDMDSFNISKANRHRTIAREEGDIRFVKEGEQDETRATMSILKDGTYHLDGSNIYLRTSPNGEIVILKDGDEKTYIKLHSDGKISAKSPTEINAEAPKIITKGTDSILEETPDFTLDSSDIKLGSSGSDEPLVLGNQWNDLMEQTLDAIAEFGNTAVGNLGAPVIGAVQLGVKMQQLKQQFLATKKVLSDKAKTEK